MTALSRQYCRHTEFVQADRERSNNIEIGKTRNKNFGRETMIVLITFRLSHNAMLFQDNTRILSTIRLS